MTQSFEHPHCGGNIDSNTRSRSDLCHNLGEGLINGCNVNAAFMHIDIAVSSPR